jgi:hypothetical protein
VLLKIPIEVNYNENIFGVDETGVKWQVEKVSKTKADNPYHSIEFKDSTLFAWDWVGCRDSVNIQTGKIINSEFIK